MDAEQNYMIERREGDEMIRMTLMDGQVRVMMCETTQMVQRAADIHNATPVCTAAMGRLMTHRRCVLLWILSGPSSFL